MLVPTAIAFLQDLFLLISVACALYVMKLKPLLAYMLMVSLACTLSLYPMMLREFLNNPINLFEIDFNTLYSFLVHYSGLTILGLPLLFLLSAIIVYRTSMSLPPIIIHRAFKFLVLVLILCACFSFFRPSPHPIVYSIQQSIENLIKNEKRSLPSLLIAQSNAPCNLRTLAYPQQKAGMYDHVLLLVLEGISADAFETEFIPLSNGFFQKNQHRMHYYSQYHTHNLDSYTSLMAMTTGIFVPYRSYTDPSQFENVNLAPNIVEWFNHNSFHTLFVSTYAYQPFVPSSSFWNDQKDGKDFLDKKEFVTIGVQQMEKATEDKVAIDTIIETMKSHPKTFIMHELAYGHTPQWQEMTGKTPLMYYNEYLSELQEKLDRLALSQKTLIIVVSDHGNRMDATAIEHYRVPLMMVSNAITQPQYIHTFLSHRHLPTLLFSSLQGAQSPTPTTDFLLTVGSSEKWIYGMIDTQKHGTFIDNSKGITKKQNGLEPSCVHQTFQNYLNEFNGCFLSKSF